MRKGVHLVGRYHVCISRMVTAGFKGPLSLLAATRPTMKVKIMKVFNNNNNNNNNNNKLHLSCYPVAVVILHVNKT